MISDDINLLTREELDVLSQQFNEEGRRDGGDILQEMTDTFRERSKTYKDNYLIVGNVMEKFFPNGVVLKTAEDFNRWHLFELVIVKMTRFAVTGLTHQDSIHDAGVYCAMAESVLQNDSKSLIGAA